MKLWSAASKDLSTTCQSQVGQTSHSSCPWGEGCMFPPFHSIFLFFFFFLLLLCRVFALCWRATLVERSAVINVCNENRKYFYVTYTPSSGDAMTIRKGRKGGWCSRPLTFTRLRGGSVQRKHLESMSWEANRWSGGVCAGLGSSNGRPGG